LPLGELAKRALPYLEKAELVKKEDGKILEAIALIQDRLKNLAEAPSLTEFLFKKPEYDKELLIMKGASLDITRKSLEESYKVLGAEEDFSHDSLESLLRALAQKLDVSAGYVLWPIRVALSGKPASPGTFELLSFFEKEESLARIKTAIDMLKL
jgi:glutamyl-tRNA synthetase